MRLQPVSAAQITRLASVAPNGELFGKIHLPVDAQSVIYSRFKHIHGVPAMGNGEGFPLVSLRAMDNLIDRLISVRAKNIYAGDVAGLEGSDIAVEVSNLQRKLHAALKAPSHSMVAGLPVNDLGLSLDIVA